MINTDIDLLCKKRVINYNILLITSRYDRTYVVKLPHLILGKKHKGKEQASNKTICKIQTSCSECGQDTEDRDFFCDAIACGRSYHAMCLDISLREAADICKGNRGESLHHQYHQDMCCVHGITDVFRLHSTWS